MIVLYMLNRCSVPLSKSQIYDFVLDQEYTTFMTLQEVFSELVSTGLISENVMANRTYLELTEEGDKALSLFENRINPAIRQQIDQYLKDNDMKIRDESSITGDYLKTAENEFTVRLSAKDNNRPLMDISFAVPTDDMAGHVLDKWQQKNKEIYKYLMETLLGD